MQLYGNYCERDLQDVTITRLGLPYDVFTGNTVFLATPTISPKNTAARSQ